MNRQAMAELLAVPSGSVVLILAYVVIFPVGMITLAVGLWRSRQVPRLVAGLLAVAAVAHIMSPAGVIGAVLTIPLLMATAVLATRLWTGAVHRTPGSATA